MASVPQPIVVTAVVLCDPDGRVAAVRKSGTVKFMHPGGKPEPGEHPAHTGARECAEELGLLVDPESLRRVGRFEVAAANEPGRALQAEVYAAPPLSREQCAGLAPHAEIAELRWLTRRDADELDARGELAPLFPVVAAALETSM